MLQNPISITALSSISPLGKSLNEAWNSYQNNRHHISEKTFENGKALVAQISAEAKQDIKALRLSDNKYKTLDHYE